MTLFVLRRACFLGDCQPSLEIFETRAGPRLALLARCGYYFFMRTFNISNVMSQIFKMDAL